MSGSSCPISRSSIAIGHAVAAPCTRSSTIPHQSQHIPDQAQGNLLYACQKARLLNSTSVASVVGCIIVSTFQFVECPETPPTAPLNISSNVIDLLSPNGIQYPTRSDINTRFYGSIQPQNLDSRIVSPVLIQSSDQRAFACCHQDMIINAVKSTQSHRSTR